LGGIITYSNGSRFSLILKIMDLQDSLLAFSIATFNNYIYYIRYTKKNRKKFRKN
jgi:hypothetical protein